MDDFSINRDHELFLYFEVHGFNGQMQPEGIQWTICQLFDRKYDLISGKYALPLYFLETRTSLPTLHLSLKTANESKLLLWVANINNSAFETQFDLADDEYLPSELHVSIKQQDLNLYAKQLFHEIKQLEDDAVKRDKRFGTQESSLYKVPTEQLQEIKTRLDSVQAVNYHLPDSDDAELGSFGIIRNSLKSKIDAVQRDQLRKIETQERLDLAKSSQQYREVLGGYTWNYPLKQL